MAKDGLLCHSDVCAGKSLTQSGPAVRRMKYSVLVVLMLMPRRRSLNSPRRRLQPLDPKVKSLSALNFSEKSCLAGLLTV